MITAPVVFVGDPVAAELRAILQFGDVLLYTPASRFSFSAVITVKTWSDFSHSELYLGECNVERMRDRGLIASSLVDDAKRAGAPLDVYASRDPKRWLPWPSGGGVNLFSLRTAQLGVVRRPREPVDVDAVLKFCAKTAGQRYDWWGLLRFYTIGKGKPDRMFCSEAVTRALRTGGPLLFDNRDADQVSPGMLDETRDLFDIWRRADLCRS